MATEKQIEAIRRNAAKSTGPRTLVGKPNSARNTDHATLLGHTVRIGGENPASASRTSSIALVANTGRQPNPGVLLSGSWPSPLSMDALSRSSRASLAWRALSDGDAS